MDEIQKEALKKKYGISGGRVVEPPTSGIDNITDPQQRLAEFKKQASMTDTVPTAPTTEKKTVGGFAKNVGKSGANLVGGVIKALLNPVDTLKSVGNLGLGTVQKVAGYDGEAADSVDQIVDFYKQRYGKDLKETLYEDPVGVIADLSTILGGGGALLKGVGKIGALAEAPTLANNARRLGQIAEKGSIVTDPLRMATKGAGALSKEVGLTDSVSKAKTFTSQLFKNADEPAIRETGGIKKQIENKIIDSNIDLPTQTILKKRKPGETVQKAAQRLEKDYVKYSQAEELYKAKGPQVDNALQVVGTEIGEGYKSIIGKQQELGTLIGKARKEAKTPVNITPAQDFLAKELKENGVLITPRGPKIQKGYTSKLTSREISTLVNARKELAKLTKNPTAENLSNFKNRIAKDIDFSKPMGKSLPDAERIMRGVYDNLAEALNIKEAPDLQGLYAMNKEYERLSKLLDEGEGILGKKSITGDYKHDAGLAKASIKSLHSGSKKDFLQALSKETGEDYIQKSMVAAQAMKDLGNYQQASLLEELVSGNARVNASDFSPGGVVNKVIDTVREKGTEMIVGTPKERTIKYIKKGADTVKTRMNNAKNKASEIPKKEPNLTQKTIKNLTRQAGYSTSPGGSAIRVRNAQLLKANGEED